MKNIDEYLELRSWAFRVLKEIAEKQLAMAKNLETSNKAREWDIYLKKQTIKLNALGNARQTVDTLIKNIDNTNDITKTLKKIEEDLKKIEKERSK